MLTAEDPLKRGCRLLMVILKTEQVGPDLGQRVEAVGRQDRALGDGTSAVLDA